MKIALINQPLGNRGDEAAHKAFVTVLSETFSNDTLDVVFFNEEKQMLENFDVKKRNVNYRNFKVLRKGAFASMKYSIILGIPLFAAIHPASRCYINFIKDVDLVICAPGGICMGGFQDWSHIWQLEIAKFYKKKIIYWGRSIGPFYDTPLVSKIFKNYSINLLHYFSYISLRDKVSLKIAKDLNLDVDETVDSAFMYRPSESIPSEFNEFLSNDYIVFVPNELKWHYRYSSVDVKEIDKFYIFIINAVCEKYSSYKIVMLPQLFKSKSCDYLYFKKLYNISEHKERILVIDENQSSDIQQAIISKSKFVIGARYHSIIFAINNKIPFLSLSYEHKMRGILESLNLSDRQIDIEKFFLSSDFTDKNEIYENIKLKIDNFDSIDDKYSVAKQIVDSAFDNMLKVANAIGI